MSAPVSQVVTPGADIVSKTLTLVANTAQDYALPAAYNNYEIVSDPANTSKVHFRTNAATGGSDPTIAGADTHNPIEIGAAKYITQHRTTVLRFKSSANASVTITPYQPANLGT